MVKLRQVLIQPSASSPMALVNLRAVSTFCKSTEVPPNPYLRDVTVYQSHSALISSYYLKEVSCCIQIILTFARMMFLFVCSINFDFALYLLFCLLLFCVNFDYNFVCIWWYFAPVRKSGLAICEEIKI